MNHWKSKKSTTQDTTSSGAAMKGERLRSVQEALKAKGYDPGPVDGVFGRKTKAAPKDFRKAEKLLESGRQDPETLAKLGV
jgi:peptidoglycan hydrolase-like protein with peptidoglycan-binding domain